MGGLVIKKAFVLARQIKEFESIYRRVRSIFFLATPHRGADMAQLLSRILSVAPGSRPFVSDLRRNSPMIQAINEEFPQYCHDIQLFSFYETLPMGYGIGKGLIVEKDLAMLGYSNERAAYLDANHRDVARFLLQSDSSYITIRNALATTIERFRDKETFPKRRLEYEQRQMLDDFLGVCDAPEDDLMSFNDLRLKGSCEWFLQKNSFRRWQDTACSQLLWLRGKPAAGKSVLAGYVVKHLKDLDRDCSFYFFIHGDKGKSTINSFLRSVAWQMAAMHPDILRIINEISSNWKDEQLGKVDHNPVWRRLFLNGILKVKLNRTQYWVIDSLDECKHGSELLTFLTKAQEMWPLCILITSRNDFEMLLTVQPKADVILEQILEDDTKTDISLLLDANSGSLPAHDELARQQMVQTILEKSAGCFLWVKLVLNELKQVHTSAEILQVLEDVPCDMDELYSRILESMSKASYGKDLAKAILTWSVCSVRPLSAVELHHALEMDIKDTIDNIERSIATSCGHIVFVDAQSRVQLVHLTAREFLTRKTVQSEFAIDKYAGHKRLAMTCLQYLSSNEMKGPRHRMLSISSAVIKRSPFADYACNSLFQHLIFVSSTNDEVLISLAKFLNSYNVLSWIEYLAQNSDLPRLIQAGKSIRNFLQRRSQHMSPFGKEVATLNHWSDDLIRLVTKFGKQLLYCPSSIFYLIPPFCPAESAIKQQFAYSTRGIAVLGLSSTTWDDCLSVISFARGQRLSALACSDRHFVLGMSSGKILVYDDITCQELQVLEHKEPVMVVLFGDTGKILASSGAKMVRIWDLTSQMQVWQFNIPYMCMCLAFADQDRLLLGALKNNQLMCWDLNTGAVRHRSDWTEVLESESGLSFRRPTTAVFNMQQNLLAIIYRGQDILLWDFERDDLYDMYEKSAGSRSGTGQMAAGSATVWSLVFNPAPDANSLVAAYSDGDLVLFDTYLGTVRETFLANAQTLSCSPDGRTLATGDSSGTIQLFDFETLKFLYRINPDADAIGVRSLAFSADSHRLLDICGSQCRIWDPLVLVRQETDDENTDTVSVSTAPQEINLDSPKEQVHITALSCHPAGEVVFCGKEDASICLYETGSGQQCQNLFSHAAGVPIGSIHVDYESNFLSCVDSSSRVTSRKVIRQGKTWRSSEPVLDHRAGAAVNQILGNGGHTRLLVSSTHEDALWCIEPDRSVLIKSVTWEERRGYKWANHPAKSEHLILITGSEATIYNWQTLDKLSAASSSIPIETKFPDLNIRTVMPLPNCGFFATTAAEPGRGRSQSKFQIWETRDFTIESERARPLPGYEYLSDEVEHLIGPYGQRLVFLHSSGWVCSVDLENPGYDSFVRHFFIPVDWLSMTGDLMIELTRNGDIVFVKRAELAVIKRGLEVTEKGAFNARRRTPSPGKSGAQRPPLTNPPWRSY
jgi:WD40 repeat protein